MFNPKKVLLVSPHTDDIELGAGGTVNRLTQNGCEIFSVIFSIVSDKVTMRTKEVMSAGSKIGIRQDNIILLNYTNRAFGTFRQEILQNLIDLRNEIKPDMVFIPCSFDNHQDHIVVHNESMRAFKNNTILGYELPWNITSSDFRLLVGLNYTDAEAKIAACLTYETMSGKPYMNRDYLRALMIVNGKKTGQAYGERFEVLNWTV